ncbi:PDZ domain-containing protein [Paenibacillus doosanensis]|uniref:Cell division topological determinant MinJ n=1 Tax=Paenibacillus konkukensis TaxID=2020716 RepID=A0ABY4RQB1_9BACL|nr:MULTISPECIES: PDZ domain-containing protein [Paenibacillus]MCS7459924.1 PDZ domain-containing protein [Paenibacillus doosanensis]UQZ84368.1 Cell division topological determinant MinJ [Paenibacillus konkukensis]
MTVLLEVAKQGLHALFQLLIHPFYYIGILLIVLQYRRQIMFERKLFHTKLHSLISETWRALLWGWIGGILASVLMAAVGATLTVDAVILLWIVSLVFILFRVRFLCWAYAIGAIGIVHVLFLAIPALADAVPRQLAEAVAGLNMPSLLALAAVLHLVEAVLVRIQGTRTATPMFYGGKRGKIVGGYHLQGFWPVALFLLVPVQGGSAIALPWTPLLGGDLWSGGWAIVGFPVMIGFAEMTMSRRPQEKVRMTSRMLIVYALAVLLLALLAYLWPVLTLVASLLCILLHEALLWYSRYDESRRSPIFVHDGRGLKVLGVLPGSAAEELGIVPGEILHKVNGFPVKTKQELHQAMQVNSAFCKLEVLNLEGESKFLKRAIFSGEHHQLGILLAPDQDALYYAEEKQTHIIAYMRKKLVGIASKPSGTKPM